MFFLIISKNKGGERLFMGVIRVILVDELLEFIRLLLCDRFDGFPHGLPLDGCALGTGGRDYFGQQLWEKKVIVNK